MKEAPSLSNRSDSEANPLLPDDTTGQEEEIDELRHVDSIKGLAEYEFVGLGDIDHFIKCEKHAENDIQDIKDEIEKIDKPSAPTVKMKSDRQEIEVDDQEWKDFAQFLRAHERVWNNFYQPHRFVRNVCVLGHRVKEYLDLMHVRMDDWPVWSHSWKKVLKYHRFTTGESLMLGTVLWNSDSDRPQDWNKNGSEYYLENNLVDLTTLKGNDQKGKAQTGYSCARGRQYLGGMSSEAYATYWTSVSQLVEPKKHHHKVLIIKALYNAGGQAASSNCFDSHAARVILESYWSDVKHGYVRKLGFNVLFLAALASNTAWIMYISGNHGAPPFVLSRLTGMFAVFSVLGALSDFMLHFWFLKGSGIWEFLTFWNISTLVVELLASGFLFPVLWFNDPKSSCKVTGPTLNPDEKHDCSFVWHSVAYMSAIAVKWMHLILEFMCIEFFGKSVLPAFSAITGQEARKFMAFLALVVMASFQAYWSLPIPENQPRPGYSHLWRSFTQIFRLDIMGDYDVWDLEGVHDQLNRSAPGDIWDIDEGPESQLYHDGIQLMGTFLSCFVAVGAMNVSIGVLGKAYEDNKARANQIYCHFKAGYTFKLLQRQVLRQEAIEALCGCCCPERNANTENPLKGHLIRLHANSVEKESQDDKIDRIEKDVAQIKGSLAEMKRAVDRLAGSELTNQSGYRR